MFKTIQSYLNLFMIKKKKFLFLIVLIGFINILEIGSIAFSIPFITSKLNFIPLENLTIYKYLIHNFKFINQYNIELIYFITSLNLIFCALLFNLLSNFLIFKSAYQNYTELTNRLIKIYFKKPYSFFLDTTSSTIFKNINNLPIAIAEGMHVSIFVFLPKLMFILIVVLFLYFYDPVICSLIILSLVIIYFLYSIFLKKKLAKLGNLNDKSAENKIRLLNEILEGINFFKIYSLENKQINSINFETNTHSQTKFNLVLFQNLPKYFLETITITSLIFIVYFNDFTTQNYINKIIVFGLCLYRLLPAINSTFSALASIKFNKVLIDIVVEILKIENLNKVQRRSDNITFKKELKLKNISLRLNNKKELLINNFSLTIKKFSTIGIQGNSGSGKTSICNIISNLILPTEGNLYIDDIKLNYFSKSWFKKIAYVTQNHFFFDGTLLENLFLKQKPKKKDIKKLSYYLKIFNLDERINKLDNNIYSKIDHSAKNFSYGEKQRFSIIRALLKKPEILILDEPISSLDKNSILSFNEIIEKLQGKTTIIIVSHIKRAFKKCDRVFNVKK